MSKNTLTKNVVLNLDVEIKPKKFVKVNKKKKDDSNNKQLPKKSSTKKVLKNNSVDDNSDDYVEDTKQNKKGVHVELKTLKNVVLCDEKEPIKTIYHISDIHISQKSDRYEEFRLIFNRLVEELKKDTQNAIVYVGGDFVQEKYGLYPEQIAFIKEFLTMLSDLMPVVAIIGNHDVNLNQNGNSLDVISPLLIKFNTKHKIHLLLDDGTYRYNNILFGLTTMWANEITKCASEEKNVVKIGLYHGKVYGATAENGYNIGNYSKFGVKDFTQYYDITMLGDIHKHQFLDTKKTVAYCGSVMQLNRGTELEKNGFLKWNVKTKKSEFIPIKNDWGYVRLKVNKDGVLNFTDAVKRLKHRIVEIDYEDITQEEAQKHFKKLKIDTDSCVYNEKKKDSIAITIGNGEDETKLIDINDDDAVVDNIMKYITINNDYDEELLTKISDKVKSVLKDLDYNYTNKIKNMKLKTLKYDNFFNYGEKNTINYSKLKGVVGVLGDIRAGKSTMCCDVLTYAIFGKCLRGDKFDVVNVKKLVMSTDITFEINDREYRIVRTRRINKTNDVEKRDSVEKVVFYDDKTNISRETTDATNNYIEDIICDYDNFVEITMMLQNKKNNFLDLSDAEKKGLLCKLLKLDIFDKVGKKAREKINILNTEMKTYLGEKNNTKETLGKNIQEIKNEIINVEKKLSTMKKDISDLNIVCDKNKEYKIKFDLKRSQHGENNINVDDFKKITKHIRSVENDIKNNTLYIEDLEKNVSDINAKIKINTDEKMNCKKQLLLIEKKIKKHKNIEKLHNEFLEKKREDEYKLINCVETLLMDRMPVKKEFGTDVIKLEQMKKHENKNNDAIKKDIYSNEEKIKILRDQIRKNIKQKKLDDNYNKLLEFENEHENFVKDREVYESELEKVEEKLDRLHNHEYDPKCKYCMSYEITKEKIKCTEDIKKLKKNIDDNELSLQIINNNIKKYLQYRSVYENYTSVEAHNNECEKEIKHLSENINIMKKSLELSNLKLKEFDEYILSIKNNEHIDKECKELRNEMKNIQIKVHKEYDEYLELMNEKNEILKRNNMCDNENDKFNLSLEKMSNDITKTQEKNKKLVEEIENINELKEMINEYEIKIEIIEQQYEKLQEMIKVQNMLNGKVISLQKDLEYSENTLKKYIDKENEKKILEIVLNSINKNGFIDSVLEKFVIPKLENDLNEFLKIFIPCKLAIKYKNGKFRFMKQNGEHQINGTTLSGGESTILNTCFKLTLDRYNSNLKTDFIIFDESFNFFDGARTDKIPSLLRYITNKYDHTIIISHDIRIKEFYETILEIKVVNGISTIDFQ